MLTWQHGTFRKISHSFIGPQEASAIYYGGSPLSVPVHPDEFENREALERRPQCTVPIVTQSEQ